MERTRFRFVGLIEWAIAAGAVIGLLAVGAAVFGDFRTVRPVVPVIAGAAVTPIAPAGIPPGAISVPLLVLPDGKTLAVGAPASSLDVLGPKAQTASTQEQGESGPRESRTYRYAGMDFIVVVSDERIVAIFR